MIDTRNILFVGAGSFEKVRPTDLILELQGRLPIRAKMDILGFEDYVKILSETEHNLLDQNIELLRTEGVDIGFEKGAIDEMARIAVKLNEEDNTGARRLRTVLDEVLEEINFEAPDMKEEEGVFLIGTDYVKERTSGLYQNRDLRKHLL